MDLIKHCGSGFRSWYTRSSLPFSGQSGSSINTWDENIKVQIRSVSYSYFQYKTSLYKQIYAAEGDLLYGMAAPVKVKGNIIGGLGILGSYCKVDSTVFVAGRTHIENE